MVISSSGVAIAPSPLHHPRFVVLDALETCDFGWAYLVKDLHNPGEQWVLEEFLPSAETPEDLVEVQVALRSQLAEVSHINHPQLAHSRDIVLLDDRLFWMREYVAGVSYRHLLEQRLAGGEVFSEVEVRALLAEILPVLEELHQQDLDHGQIDLDSIVRRQSDQIAVLDRFGGLRDIGLEYGFYLLKNLDSWSLESRLSGIDRDLHDLAIVALILLTGAVPNESINQLIEQAIAQQSLSPEFASILDRMLVPKPWQRFHSADEVYAALGQAASPEVLLEDLDEIDAPVATVPISIHRDPVLLILSIAFIGLMSIALWRIAHVVPIKLPQAGLFPPPAVTKPAAKTKTSNLDKAEKLGMPSDLLDRIRQELPNSDKALNAQLNRLSEEARNGMGKYYRRDYDRWFATLVDLKISQPTVDALTDTLFYLRFPELQGKELDPRTLGQIWYAIARDQITALNQKKQLEILKAGTFNQSGKLSQGQSRVFQVKVQPGQSLELKLEGQDLRLSVIENEIVLLRYGNNTQWSAPKSSQGRTYEIILTPMKLENVSYQLKLGSL
jgi:serine/threonine protein kinase, bacterial